MENFDEKNHSRSNELAQIDGIVPIWKVIWFTSISKHIYLDKNIDKNILGSNLDVEQNKNMGQK